MKGLSKCHRLSKLGLSHNKISKINNIELLPLQELNLVSSIYLKKNFFLMFYYLEAAEIFHRKIIFSCSSYSASESYGN